MAVRIQSSVGEKGIEFLGRGAYGKQRGERRHRRREGPRPSVGLFIERISQHEGHLGHDSVLDAPSCSGTPTRVVKANGMTGTI